MPGFLSAVRVKQLEQFKRLRTFHGPKSSPLGGIISSAALKAYRSGGTYSIVSLIVKEELVKEVCRRRSLLKTLFMF
jgi:hypothetical protein